MSILVKVESEIKDELRILNQYESVEEPNSVLICRKVKGKYRFSLRRKGEKKHDSSDSIHPGIHIRFDAGGLGRLLF